MDASWSTVDNWNGDTATPGDTGSTTDTDVATFDAAIANTWGDAVGNPVVIDSATQNIGGISFDTSAGNYFIGSTGGNSLLLVQERFAMSQAVAAKTKEERIAFGHAGCALRFTKSRYRSLCIPIRSAHEMTMN